MSAIVGRIHPTLLLLFLIQRVLEEDGVVTAHVMVDSATLFEQHPPLLAINAINPTEALSILRLRPLILLGAPVGALFEVAYRLISLPVPPVGGQLF